MRAPLTVTSAPSCLIRATLAAEEISGTKIRALTPSVAAARATAIP